MKPSNLEALESKSKSKWYVNLVIAFIAFAILLTSFDRSSQNLGVTLLKIDEKKYPQEVLKNLIEQERILLTLRQKDERRSGAYFLEKVKNNELLNREAIHLGIHIPKKSVEDSIRNNPLFKGALGAFDEKKLKLFLERCNTTLAALIQSERNRMGRAYLKEAIVANIPLSPDFVEYATKGVAQQRSGAFKAFKIDHYLKKTDQPSEEDKKILFSKNDHLIAPRETKISFFFFYPENNDKKNKNKIHFSAQIDQMENDIYSGKTIEEMAKKNKKNITHMAIKGDASNAGDFIKNIRPDIGQDQARDIASVFISKVNGMLSDGIIETITLPHDIGAVIKVEEIKQPRKLTYEEASPLLEKILRTQQAKDLAFKDATIFSKKPKREVMTEIDPCAYQVPSSIGSSIVSNALFEIDQSKKTHVTEKDGHIYVVLLEKVSHPPIDGKKEDELRHMVVRAWQQTLWGIYLETLDKKYKVTANVNLLKEFIKNFR